MLAFKDLLTTVETLIEAKPYFTGLEILVDDGIKKHTIEAALRDKGFCVVICPPIAGDLGEPSPKVTVLEHEVAVKILVNPTRNAEEGGANKDMLEAIPAAVQAVLAYQPSPGDRHFRSGDPVYALNTYDPGLWIYDLFFRKHCVF
jgi:hypothetical protein